MRAWLLLLAVLATFQTIVQVASTEDISVRFITAITPFEEHASRTTTKTKTTAATATATAAATTKVNTTAITKAKTTIITKTTKTTALAKAFKPFNELLPTSTKLLYKSSDSDKNKNNSRINKNKSADIIETKHINEVHKKRTEKDTKTEADQLENSKNKHNNKIVNNSNYNKNNHNNNNNNNLNTNKLKHTNKMAVKEQTQQQQQQQKQQQQDSSITETEESQKKSQKRGVSSASSSVENVDVEVVSVEFLPGSEQAPETAVPITSDSTSTMEISVPANFDAMIEEDGPSTYSNNEVIKDKVKPDPSTLVEIENSLLSLFNMKRPPKIDRSKIIIPDAMKKLYAEIMGHEIDSVNIPKPGLLTKSANTVRSFTHKNSKIDDRFPHHHRFRLHFDVKSIPADEKLKAAELQLTREALSQAALHPRQANRIRYQVLVYDITRVGVRGKREPSYLLLDSKTIRLNSTETVSLDVQPAVDRWLATPQKNYGLLVEVRTVRSLKPAPHHHVRLRRSADEAHEQWQHKQPLLFAYTDDGRHKSRSIRDVSGVRSRRSQRPRKHRDEICRRHSLYVDFSDVGWSDWIVAPPGYDAFYCHGKCPFSIPEHLNSTNHAVVQTLVNNINPGKVPKPCCVPTQLESISMLYLNDHSTVVLKNYQDMTVVGCGCR